MAGAIAINAMLFLLMLAPLRSPEPPALPEPNPQFEWIQPRVEQPPIPPPILPVTPPRPSPPVVPTVQSPPAVAPVATAAHPIAPPATSPDAAPGTEPGIDTAPGFAAQPPGAGAGLEYLRAPPPVYPRDMLAAGIEGRLVLEVLVGTDGRPLKVSVHESSGQRTLDEAARRQVLRYWLFKPAVQDGRAVRAVGLVPIAFSLNR